MRCEGENETEPLNRSQVARVATFNIKVFGKTKMSKPEIVEELVTIFERYDLVAVQENKRHRPGGALPISRCIEQ